MGGDLNVLRLLSMFFSNCWTIFCEVVGGPVSDLELVPTEPLLHEEVIKHCPEWVFSLQFFKCSLI